MVSKTDLLQKTSEYMDYISEHKKNIQKAWDEIRNATIGISLLQRPAILDEMSWRIKNHDDLSRIASIFILWMVRTLIQLLLIELGEPITDETIITGNIG